MLQAHSPTPTTKRRVARFLKDTGSALPELLSSVVAASRHGLSARAVPTVVNADGQLIEVEGAAEAEAYNPEYNQAERVIATRPDPDGGPPEWLVKWRGLPHTAATWESCRTMLSFQAAITAFLARTRTQPAPAELALAAQPAYRPPLASFRPLLESPAFRGGQALRPHQLEGLNWLLFSWLNRRSVMLADEMVREASTAVHNLP